MELDVGVGICRLCGDVAGGILCSVVPLERCAAFCAESICERQIGLIALSVRARSAVAERSDGLVRLDLTFPAVRAVKIAHRKLIGA